MIPLAILLIAGALGFYMAWNIGANDVANSMATAVGAKAITPRQAVLIAGILTAVGAIFIGTHVTGTVSKGIVDVSDIPSQTLIIGFMAALISAALWVTLSTWYEMPVSTTHSIVGAMMGFGLIAGGVGYVNWVVMGKVVLSWLLSPIAGAIISFLIFKLIVRSIFNKENPDMAAERYAPLFVFMTFFIITMSLLFKTNLGKMVGVKDDLITGILYAVVVGIVSAVVGHMFLHIKKHSSKGEGRYVGVEDIFRRLQVMTSCYVAIAIGANDVANAIGPFMGIIAVAENNTMPSAVEVPVWVLAFGGMGIAIGIFTWGYRVIKTIGFKITELTNTRGFSVDFGAATTVLVASKVGMPISTTHTVVGAVMGVGLARGIAAVDFSVIKNIIVSWLATVPIAAGTTIGIFILVQNIFI